MATIRDATALIDTDTLRAEVQLKYSEVAQHPETGFHFHIGRPLARHIGYPPNLVDPLPDSVVESFAGVNNPFSMGVMRPGEHVLDLGSGAGFDSVLAAQQVGPTGSVTGVDMTDAALEKARANARLMNLANLTFEKGFAENLPLADGSVDVVISNGVINLCPDKSAVYREIWRVLRPGGRIQLADVVVQRPVDDGAQEDIDLWTG